MDSASAARDEWFQQAAASQIKSERMGRAELLNGRVAMLGFMAAVLGEVWTGQGIVGQLNDVLRWYLSLG